MDVLALLTVSVFATNTLGFVRLRSMLRTSADERDAARISTAQLVREVLPVLGAVVMGLALMQGGDLAEKALVLGWNEVEDIGRRVPDCPARRDEEEEREPIPKSRPPCRVPSDFPSALMKRAAEPLGPAAHVLQSA